MARTQSNGLFTRLRGIGILRSSHKRNSRNFAVARSPFRRLGGGQAPIPDGSGRRARPPRRKFRDLEVRGLQALYAY